MRTPRPWHLAVAAALALANGACSPMQPATADLPAGGPERARALVERMAATVGTMEDLKRLGDVEYRYTYRKPDGSEDVSIERYRFDGELSWGRYTERSRVSPEHEGELIQGYDGSETWVTVDGRRLDDGAALRRADFLRKTNFYWFAMMQKLLDPGLRYQYLGAREVDGGVREVVRVRFDDGVGDAQDTYDLYLDPETHRVDRFLFTVMDFGVSEPHMMRIDRYATHGGVALPVTRRYAKAAWDGSVLEDAWTDEVMDDLRFGNGFAANLFAPPDGDRP